MKKGAVMVDVAIDQGGCFETSHPTTHADPTFVVDGVLHYCVANMPGAVARTSTFALNNATLPHALALADKGWLAAMRDDPHLRHGLNAGEGPGHATRPWPRRWATPACRPSGCWAEPCLVLLVRQELARHDDVHAVALGVGLALRCPS